MFRNLTLAMVFIGIATALSAQEITVTGQGSVDVPPDMARITFGVTKEATTAKDALDQMSNSLASVLAELAEAGVPDTAIQTSALRLDLRQDYNSVKGEARITGYLANSNVSVTVSDLADLGRLLDAVVGAGATQMNGLQFDVKDRSPHLEAARRAAVADGKAKATVFADAAGLSLGALLQLNEGGAQAGPIMMEASMARDAGVPTAPGEITISATITMRYAAE